MKYVLDTERIKAEMERQGISAKGLSEKCGRPLTEVISVFNAQPQAAVVFDVCKALGLDIYSVFVLK